MKKMSMTKFLKKNNVRNQNIISLNYVPNFLGIRDELAI